MRQLQPTGSDVGVTSSDKMAVKTTATDLNCDVINQTCDVDLKYCRRNAVINRKLCRCDVIDRKNDVIDWKMAVKMAATDLDTTKTDRRPSLVDLRNVLSLDDFDAFCAQASSGGSIYGMLRKQIYLSGPAACVGQDKGKRVPPEKRVMLRQRSKSLIQRSVALSEEKSIIKLLCDYSETAKSKQRLLRDNRRHSEVNYTDDEIMT